VHLAVRLARTRSQAEFVEKLKKASSAWMKEQGPEHRDFFWQAGYGCFSVGWSQLEELIRYIDHQEEHHRKLTFQEEYRNFLSKYQVDYREEYVWD
jgi:REP element-mobilizing transposase RayT